MAACVTAEQCKVWEKSGRHEFLKYCQGIVDKKALVSLGNHDFRQAILDVCHHVVHGNLKPEQAVAVFSDLKTKHSDLPSLLVDILGLIDIELSCTEDGKQAKDKLISLIQACCNGLDCEGLVKSRLDPDTLEHAGLVQNKTVFTQRHVKIKTRLYYKQQKFNLLREESEGYSKLVTELNQEQTEQLTPERMLQNIKSLIGCFNLDPNRVIDILLESFESHLDLEEFYIPLIKSYIQNNETLCHILGFKFQFFKDEETPASLYKLAASLLKNDLIELDTLYLHLSPSDSAIQDHSKKEMADAKAYARKFLVVSLSDKSSEDKKADDDNNKIDPHENNQKLGLAEALLSLGAWETAKCILDRLPEFFGTTYKPIASALCALIHTVLDPAYRKFSGMSAKLVAKRGKHELAGCEIQKATTFNDVHNLVFPMVTYLGPYVACDPVLIVKLVRLGRYYMTKRNQGSLTMEDNIMYFGLLSIMDEVLIPSVSFLTCNCCVSEELWTLLKMFPYELRYRMYGNWKNEMYSVHPKLIKVKTDCLEKAKYIMKRLSKENVKPSGRQLGKLSHSNPGVLFEYVIKQIERYDNLIGPVVDSLKYLTNFSYDILVFCIIEAVANPEKEKMKFDDTSLSLWLQSIANFAGSICKKYQVELGGLMQYVTNQLKAGKSIDMLLMREIVQKMAGVEISEEITMDQLEAMSGGELLRQEGGYFAQVRNTKKSSNRLKETVLENDLALALCLLISQQRDAVIYKEGSAKHLKLVGKLYDQCQDTLVQFGSFLSMQLSTEEFVKRLPPIDKMVSEYHVPADAAFFLSRPLYSYEIAIPRSCKRWVLFCMEKVSNFYQSKFDELRKAEKMDKEKKSSSASKVQLYIQAAESVTSPIVECVRPLQSTKIWEDLSPTFYVTFWSLWMYDIHVPVSAYEKQVAQLNQQISAIEDNKDMPQSKRKKEKDRCNQLIDKLKDEEKKQNEHTQRVLARLQNEKESWFVSRSTKNETITQFLQLCIFPRCCFTASDAVYCAEFIHILHNLKTPNFSTLICYDRIFCDITYTVSSCTENEAHRYGRFLCAALETVMRWHSNKQYYDKECGTYPGFVTVFRKGENSNNKADQLDFENYRHVCHKWHFRITKAMVACIESGNYIQIRNALIVLTKILPLYPRIIQFGSPLERRVDKLRQEEKEKRPDLYALAMGYSGQLKSRKTSWVNETEFHLRDKEKKGSAAAAAPSANSDNSTAGSVKSEPGSKDKVKMVNGEKSSGSSNKENRPKVKTEKVKTEEKVKPSTSTGSEMKKTSADVEKKESARSKILPSQVKTEKVKTEEKVKPSTSTGSEMKKTSADVEKKETARPKVKTERVKTEEKVKPSTITSSEMKKISTDVEKKESASSKTNMAKEKKEKERKSSEKEKSKERDEAKSEKPREEKEKRRDDDLVLKMKSKEDRQMEKQRLKEEKMKEKKEERREERTRELKIKEEKRDSDYDAKPEKLRLKTDKGSKEESKEKKDKESRKEDRIKLKRSYSPEDVREHHREEWEERASVTSNGSGHRSHHQSPEESPRYSDERDVKRRKTDVVASSSKDDTAGSSKSRHRKSTSPVTERSERDKERREKKRLKKEGKHSGLDNSQQADGSAAEDYSDHEATASSSKRRRSAEPTSSRSSSKMNGEPEERVRSRDEGHSKSSSRKEMRESDLDDSRSKRSRSKEKEKKKDRSEKERSGKHSKKS